MTDREHGWLYQSIYQWTDEQIIKQQNLRAWGSPSMYFFGLEACACVCLCVCGGGSSEISFLRRLPQPRRPESESSCATLGKLLTRSNLSETTPPFKKKKWRPGGKIKNSEMHKSICYDFPSLQMFPLYIFYFQHEKLISRFCLTGHGTASYRKTTRNPPNSTLICHVRHRNLAASEAFLWRKCQNWHSPPEHAGPKGKSPEPSSPHPRA